MKHAERKTIKTEERKANEVEDRLSTAELRRPNLNHVCNAMGAANTPSESISGSLISNCLPRGRTPSEAHTRHGCSTRIDANDREFGRQGNAADPDSIRDVSVRVLPMYWDRPLFEFAKISGNSRPLQFPTEGRVSSRHDGLGVMRDA